MNEELEIAKQVDRMAVAPVLYDTIFLNYTVAAASGGVQAVTLNSGDYEAFKKGTSEAGEGAGYTATKDAWFTNAYKDGVFDKTDAFLIYGIGFQFTGTPFIATAGVASGTSVVGTQIDAAVHAEPMANLALQQLYVTVGADEEDCVALAGPLGLWPFGGMNLGDNAVSPRLSNSLMGNERLFRYAVPQHPLNAKDGVAVRLVRSEHMSITYGATTALATGTAVYPVHVIAYGRRVPKNSIS